MYLRVTEGTPSRSDVPWSLLSSLLTSLLASLLAMPAVSQSGSASTIEVRPLPERHRVVVRVDGEPFTEVRFGDEGHLPYLYPVYGPGELAMTRGWPMAEVENEERDHPHHRSLWFAHGDVNGHDFWTGRDGARIEQVEILEAESGTEGRLRTRNHWYSPDGGLVAIDERTLRFASGDGWRSIDFEVTLRPAAGELKLGDTKEGTMAIRVAPWLRHSGEVASGRMRNSEGQLDGDCWGKRARWVQYWGELQGRTMGIAILDHPRNPRHPTWWHARTYGLFAANPFGVHDFEQRPAGSGDLIVPAGETLELRYRLLLYEGEWGPAELERAFTTYAGE